MLKTSAKMLINKKLIGFSLIELLISMVIFMVVLLVLSTLFMRVVDLSVAQDAKNSFLTQIQNIALNIKNTFRNTKSFFICPPRNNNTTTIIMNLNNDNIKIINYANDRSRLTEKTLNRSSDLSGTSSSSNYNYCNDDTSGMSSMHSSSVQIRSFNVRTKSDLSDIQIIYITIDACSTDLLPRLNLYHCSGQNSSNYRYAFAVVARNR